MKPFHTPRTRTAVTLYAILVYITIPVVVLLTYLTIHLLGFFPPPPEGLMSGVREIIIGSALVFIPTFPVFALILYISIRKYPGSVLLWVWNYQRPIWSTLCTILFLIAAIYAFTGAITSFFNWGYAEAPPNMTASNDLQFLSIISRYTVGIYYLIVAHLILVLRSAIVTGDHAVSKVGA